MGSLGGDGAPTEIVGAPPYAPVRLSSGRPVQVISAEARRSVGLDLWVDGSMGFLRRGAATIVISPNGGRLARHDLAAGDFSTGLTHSSIEIQGRRGPWDHASGGSLIQDPETGELLLVYHGETHTAGDPHDYYSFLGLATSPDEGRSFRDLGPIVVPDRPDFGPDRSGAVEVGPGPVIELDGTFLVYFQDRSVADVRRHLCVAAIPSGELFACTRAGLTPRFDKYHAGSFCSPGIGGPADDLLPGAVNPVLWFDVAVVPAVAAVLLVFSTVTVDATGSHRWTHMAAWSPDGTRFGPVVPISADTSSDEMLYMTIDSGGTVQRRIDTPHFDLYRVRSSSAWRWSAAIVERVPMEIRLG